MLASLLIVGGLIVLLALQRVPLPLRIIGGLGDVVAGCVLLVLARQKYRAPSNDSTATNL
ncbi:MAG: hypothetical protein ABIZ49_02350 [Opitutaceae bacterium]